MLSSGRAGRPADLREVYAELSRVSTLERAPSFGPPIPVAVIPTDPSLRGTPDGVTHAAEPITTGAPVSTTSGGERGRGRRIGWAVAAAIAVAAAGGAAGWRALAGSSADADPPVGAATEAPAVPLPEPPTAQPPASPPMVTPATATASVATPKSVTPPPSTVLPPRPVTAGAKPPPAAPTATATAAAPAPPPSQTAGGVVVKPPF